MIGIAAALVLRVIFALAVTWLLQVVGLILAGGLLLMWVAWRMWRELRHEGIVGGDSPVPDHDMGVGDAAPLKSPKSFAAAAWSVALADVSMSLDNVLAVAGAARDHPGIMVAGLILSVALMGLAANVIAQYIERYRWIAYVGLVVIVWVAIKMIWEGWNEVAPHIAPLIG
jgi:YjbE family integral membrane protein